MTPMLDFNNLTSLTEAEPLIEDMDAETTLSYINLLRERQLQNPEGISELETIVGMKLVRHLRTLRESKTRTKSASKSVAVAPLDSLL